MPSDTRALMEYDARKRSLVIAYLLWFFLGYGGVHRFYLGRWFSGLLMLALLGLAVVMSFIPVLGWFFWGPTILWWAVDAVFTVLMVNGQNARLIRELAR